MNPLKTDIYRLGEFEEAVGCLNALEVDDEFLIAGIGRIRVLLPQRFKKCLEPFLGERMAIIRTDDPERPFRFRKIDSANDSGDKL